MILTFLSEYKVIFRKNITDKYSRTNVYHYQNCDEILLCKHIIFTQKSLLKRSIPNTSVKTYPAGMLVFLLVTYISAEKLFKVMKSNLKISESNKLNKHGGCFPSLKYICLLLQNNNFSSLFIFVLWIQCLKHLFVASFQPLFNLPTLIPIAKHFLRAFSQSIYTISIPSLFMQFLMSDSLNLNCQLSWVQQ